MYKDQVKNEFNRVRFLGEEIGYGNLMQLASSLWRQSLREKGYPTGGAFIPTIGKLSGDELMYDEYLKEMSK